MKWIVVCLLAFWACSCSKSNSDSGGSSGTSSQIVYQAFPASDYMTPDAYGTPNTNTGTVSDNIDLNGDGVPDLELYYNYEGVEGWEIDLILLNDSLRLSETAELIGSYVASGSADQPQVYAVGPTSYASGATIGPGNYLQAGTTLKPTVSGYVDSTSRMETRLVVYELKTGTQITGPEYQYSYIQNGNNYIGFALLDSQNNYHYGWLDLSEVDDLSGQQLPYNIDTLRITSAAYNKTAGQTIMAGQKQ